MVWIQSPISASFSFFMANSVVFFFFLKRHMLYCISARELWHLRHYIMGFYKKVNLTLLSSSGVLNFKQCFSQLEM